MNPISGRFRQGACRTRRFFVLLCVMKKPVNCLPRWKYLKKCWETQKTRKPRLLLQYIIGEIFLRQEDSQNAEKYFLLAYENYPAHAQREYALLSLARILQKEKRYEAAEKRYEEYRLIFPCGRYEVYAVLQAVRCLFNAREYKEADLELETLKSASLTDDERSMADCLHAASFYQQGKYDESERWYKNVLEGYIQGIA